MSGYWEGGILDVLDLGELRYLSTGIMKYWDYEVLG